MANPDYATLLALIAAETDPVVIAQLEAQCYVFNEILTEAEKELFEYAAFDYMDADYAVSGYVELSDSNTTSGYSSYVGIYFSDNGERT